MFNLFLDSQPLRFLKKLDKVQRTRIWEKLDELKSDPFPHDVKRVVGKKHKSFRVRVGEYRILYFALLDKKEILIFKINKRSRAYN